MFRTAEGFGVTKIICSGYTPYPTMNHDSRLPHIADKLTKQIHKTALGAEELVSFEQYDELETWLSTNTLPLVALEQSATSIPLSNFHGDHDIALLLGEEVHGIEDKYLQLCETTLEIPMHGRKESFNVSVACGIALYVLTH